MVKRDNEIRDARSEMKRAGRAKIETGVLPVIFCNGNADLFVTVTPSVNGFKRYQATVWDSLGAISDSKHDSAEELMEHQICLITRFSTEQEFNNVVSK